MCSYLPCYQVVFLRFYVQLIFIFVISALHSRQIVSGKIKRAKKMCKPATPLAWPESCCSCSGRRCVAAYDQHFVVAQRAFVCVCVYVLWLCACKFQNIRLHSGTKTSSQLFQCPMPVFGRECVCIYICLSVCVCVWLGCVVVGRVYYNFPLFYFVEFFNPSGVFLLFLLVRRCCCLLLFFIYALGRWPSLTVLSF